ncbi:DUF5320 domain-containing protein [Patescibacteria group bacterium]|nr:DUF5320 domain-containing protein [Patescibacteria group bacterium]
MPNLDGTGPNGKGPKTGRGQGNCKGADKASPKKRLLGLGNGNGSGRGQGLGRRRKSE